MTIKSSQATVGETVVITCYSEGVPDPHFTIVHNGKNITTKNPYTIDSVQKLNEGTYTCIAINDLGNDTATGTLNVTGENNFFRCICTFLSTLSQCEKARWKKLVYIICNK